MDSMSSRETLLVQVRTRASKGEAVAGLIDTYTDCFEVTLDAQEVFEVVLRSRSLTDREAALRALVDHGKLLGYEADALLLTLKAEPDDSNVKACSATYL